MGIADDEYIASPLKEMMAETEAKMASTDEGEKPHNYLRVAPH